MVFRWFWGTTTIANDGFRWLCTIGPAMEWLCTIVEVYINLCEFCFYNLTCGCILHGNNSQFHYCPFPGKRYGQGIKSVLAQLGWYCVLHTLADNISDMLREVVLGFTLNTVILWHICGTV